MIISITFLFCALIARLFVLQVVDGEDLRAKAAEQWYRDLPLKAPRGKIYDRNKQPLAVNADVYSVYVRPSAVNNPQAVASDLAKLLDLSYEKLYARITGERVSEITVKKSVDKETGEKIRRLRHQGVYLTIDSKRVYPTGGLSQVLGFTNIDNVGQNGLEGYYDKYLTGVDGFEYVATDIRGNELDGALMYVPSIEGCSLTLTIDKGIQALAESAVIDAMTEWKSRSASMIVMDCKSGGILAMAIAPSFDLNDIPRDDIAVLNALSKNTLVVDVYEPGSTFKTFTGAIAVDSGIGENRNYYCPGYRIVDGQRIKCWRYIGHGSVDLSGGFKNSCNCVFMDLALSLGTERLYNGLSDFGFGQKTNIDFYGESKGLVMKKESVKTVDLARIGFGQAIAVTPIQMVTAFSAVVNGGVLYEPRLVNSIDSFDGKNVYSAPSKKVRQVISAETSKKMREYLALVVAEGSGKKAQVENFFVGGKTGTAQKYENGSIARGKYVSSFIGAAPIDDPEYVALMIVDEPQGYVYYGSITAAPYVGRVFAGIAASKGIKANTPVYTSEMPYLRELALSEAIAQLNKMGINYEICGEGTMVKETVPIYGSPLIDRDVVLLRLG